jgi:splicing factor 3A subunit 2
MQFENLARCESFIDEVSSFGGLMSKDWGSKPGSAGVMSDAQANIDRRERLRQLAMETVDLAKDPYFMRNHLGSYECKLCLTLHTNEGSYLAHTQGKRHQQNLARRAAKLAKETNTPLAIAGARAATAKLNKIEPRKTPKIGLPEHYVFKVRHPQSQQLGLLFIIKYPRIQEDLQPRTRFMSAVEQKVEPVDLNYQYVLFAAEPYNTIAFKVPSKEVDRTEGKFISDWNAHAKIFSVSRSFVLSSFLILCL